MRLRGPLPPLLLLAPAALVGGCPESPDPGDLRLEARMILATAEASPEALTLADLLGPPSAPIEVPRVIRVWRRGLDGSDSSCEGRVDVLDLEDYVRGVLPSEWLSGWTAASLDAGAIAARTYASFWAAAGGRYRCADVDDTTWTQVYRDERYPSTDAAVERTEGAVAVRDGSLVYAEYSAELGDRTAFGVSDPPCSGEAIRGHGRGLCQRGSERWGLAGKDAAWMIAHYYDGARLAWADEALIDRVALDVRSGERFRLSLEVTNPGPDPWAPGTTSVATDASAFADQSWTAPDRPVVRGASVPAADTAALSWRMRAPVVEEPTTYTEFFWIDGPGAGRRGTAGSWQITVWPAGPQLARGDLARPQGPPWSWFAALRARVESALVHLREATR